MIGHSKTYLMELVGIARSEIMMGNAVIPMLLREQ
jgi:hypothetical protein